MIDTVGDIVESLIDEGYQMKLGPHDGFPGYYCAIYKPGDFEQCPECDNESPMSWTDSGHGPTLLSAILNAIELKEGKDAGVDISEFE